MRDNWWMGIIAFALVSGGCSDDSGDSVRRDGGVLGVGGSNAGGTGGSTTGCNDTGPGEPTNNSESGAVSLPNLSDSDPSTYPQITGTIGGSSDVDWYTYTGSDDSSILALVDPYVAFPTDLGLRLCTYFECLAFTTLITCPSGTTSSTSPAGRPGCCATGNTTAFTVIDAYCGVTSGVNDDSMRVFVRVDGPNLTASACTSYTVKYHF
jgi:hypothetical protein